jgi:predicted ATPase
MLVTDPGIKSLLLLGCYRSDEVMDDHPLKTQLASIQEAGVNVTILRLQNMDRSSVNDLLSDTLRLPPRITRSLANAIHSKTSGNPLFVTQFIRSLVDQKLLTWSAERRRWVWDTPTIQAKNIDDTVVGLMTAKMLRLSVDVQKGPLHASI